jgi:hypothetical protein
VGKRKGTPDDIDYLFERDIVDEEDYIDFWSEYWSRNAQGRRELEKEYVDRAAEEAGTTLVYRNRADAEKQAQALGNDMYRVTRRNASGRFSKRGTYYQAIKQVLRRRK